MKLGSLRAVDAFVRLGGTGEAAQGLGMSQSAVIKTLRQAEQELDLSLATTIQGRLVPTPEAQSLVRQAQPLFDVLRRARHEADMIRVGMAENDTGRAAVLRSAARLLAGARAAGWAGAPEKRRASSWRHQSSFAWATPGSCTAA